MPVLPLSAFGGRYLRRLLRAQIALHHAGLFLDRFEKPRASVGAVFDHLIEAFVETVVRVGHHGGVGRARGIA